MNKGWKQKDMSGLVPILISVGVFIVLIFILGVGAAYLIQNEYLSYDALVWIEYIIPFLSAFAGNVLLLKNINEGLIVRLLISTGAMIILWALIGIMFFDGLASAGWGSALTTLVGAAIVFVLPYIKPSKQTYKKYRSC